jgi:hypothetical protein
MKVDFAKFKNSLPYASELYGVFQPLLGWRSRIRSIELLQGHDSLKRSYLAQLQLNTKPLFKLFPAGMDEAPFRVSLGQLAESTPPLGVIDSIVARKVGDLVAAAGDGRDAWEKFTREDELQKILDDSRDVIQHETEQVLASKRVLNSTLTNGDADLNSVLVGILARESAAAGALRRLGAENAPEAIAALMSSPLKPTEMPFNHLVTLLAPDNSNLLGATISPIGLVRLYRQYFFEFDTFLGAPVQHLWLSPGGSVELIEISTRRTLIERTLEHAFESIEKSEKSLSIEDELSNAVRSENGDNTKLGVTLSTTGSYGVGFVDGSSTAGTSLNVEQSSKDAREQTHRSLRQQTEKLSSEIRKSFKSTFKTVSEATDTQSRRYTLSNTTKELINYELRRKMRQVGVQVQDYGLHLCWQAYVDKPGDELGIAKLVHIAAPADLQGIKDPGAPAMPEAEIRDKTFSLRDLHFGVLKGSQIGPGFIMVGSKFQLTPPKPGYIYSRTEVVTTKEGEYATLRAHPQDPSEQIAPGLGDPPEVVSIPTGDASGATERSVRSIVLGWMADAIRYGDGHDYFWHVDVTVIWKPSRQLLNDVETTHKAAVKAATAEKERAFREALFKAARDRIKAASNIEQRKFETLREEERIVIYRNLIRKLLEVAGITNEDPNLRHVFAEIVQSMFDVDKMLYFVAPEWWMPRKFNATRQNLGLSSAEPGKTPLEPGYLHLGKVQPMGGSSGFDATNTVDWGGAARVSDYYITEDSAPATLGSSLGWLLQLDADNLRNAFLNAPWVKAVIPIRAGHELKALEWLSNAAIEGADGLGARYQATNATEKLTIFNALKAHLWDDPSLTARYAAMKDPEEITIHDAIRYLILHIQQRHEQSRTVVQNPDDATMNYLPTDEVFERGFDPLKDGFKAATTVPFEVFDQWVEVLPTDQIVPVEVKYDPKSGMQI